VGGAGSGHDKSGHGDRRSGNDWQYGSRRSGKPGFSRRCEQDAACCNAAYVHKDSPLMHELDINNGYIEIIFTLMQGYKRLARQ
jgi:hypothetical protein